MPKRLLKPSAQKRLIDNLIFLVATLQPLGTIPQIFVIFSRHDAHSISLLGWGIYIAFDIMWLWYGLADKQRAVVVSSILFTVLESAVMVGGLLYGATL